MQVWAWTVVFVFTPELEHCIHNRTAGFVPTGQNSLFNKAKYVEVL